MSTAARVARFRFFHGDADLSVGLPSQEAAAWMDGFLPDYRVDVELSGRARATADLLDFSVEHMAGGWIVHDHGLLPGARGPLDRARAWSVLERAVADRLALGLAASLERAVLLHAGGVTTDGGAVLVAGASGSGKSSVVSAFGTRGFAALGDDAVALASDGRVHPFKRPFKLHEGARLQLGISADSTGLAGSSGDTSLHHPEGLGSRWADPAPVRHVVFARRGPESDTVLADEPAVAGVRRLLDLSLGPLERAQALSRLIEGTRAARFWTLRFDRCDLARDLLRERLDLAV